jgi:hypothetical protein
MADDVVLDHASVPCFCKPAEAFDPARCLIERLHPYGSFN